MDRYLKSQIKNDLKQKMVFLAGPRQCGKTTIALDLLGKKKNRYLNWDVAESRHKILEAAFPSGAGLLVLDEIHKFTRWRDLVKGLYDSRKDDLQILVTGSAKLDHYSRGGDSLQGRYHFLRLHPLSFKELGDKSASSLEQLFKLGPFPEPFLAGSEKEARRWSREYRTRLINEELTSLETVSEISLLDLMSLRLTEGVGSSLSINSLREDLQVSHKTVSRWLMLLENLYHIFRLAPFGSSKLKAIKKDSKHYFFDWNLIQNPAARFENLIASHLLKWCHFIEDTEGFNMELRFYRDIEQREVDFVILKDSYPIEFVEVKLAKKSIDSNLIYLKKKFPEVQATQVCLEDIDDEKVGEWQIRRCSAQDYLWEKI